MSTVMRIVTLSTAAACAVTGGALFAFSTFVMAAIRSLPAPEAVAAMQAINAAAPRSGLFMLTLLGSAVGCVASGGYAIFAGAVPNRGWLITGAVLGLSVLGITGGYHVPRNDALALLDPQTPDSAGKWLEYAVGWTRWNHVRTATGIAAAIALVAGTRAG